jgi:hypothetical protein
MTAVALSMFRGKVFVSLGFSRRREFIGGRAMSGVDQGSTPPSGAVRGWPSPPDGWRVVDYYYGQAVGKLQAESMMSTAANLFPQ